MGNEVFIEQINRLRYHQSLLLEMINTKMDMPFYQLVIEKFLSKQEVEQFYKLCDNLSMQLEEQKAEGFLNYQPLFDKFKLSLHPALTAKEVVHACLEQQMYLPLMNEFKKYV